MNWFVNKGPGPASGPGFGPVWRCDACDEWQPKGLVGNRSCVTCGHPRTEWFRCGLDKKKHVHKWNEDRCEDAEKAACFQVDFDPPLLTAKEKEELESHDSAWICDQVHVSGVNDGCCQRCGATTLFQITKLS